MSLCSSKFLEVAVVLQPTLNLNLRTELFAKKINIFNTFFSQDFTPNPTVRPGLQEGLVEQNVTRIDC